MSDASVCDTSLKPVAQPDRSCEQRFSLTGAPVLEVLHLVRRSRGNYLVNFGYFPSLLGLLLVELELVYCFPMFSEVAP